MPCNANTSQVNMLHSLTNISCNCDDEIKFDGLVFFQVSTTCNYVFEAQ